MESYLKSLKSKLVQLGISFESKPIIVGGLAMEYYGLRDKGEDIDLLITGQDYQNLEGELPNARKDLWGDLGIVVDDFEIWRSISLFDYEFYKEKAIELEDFFVISLDKLLFTRVLAIKHEKYKTDIELIKAYYCEHLRNCEYEQNAWDHFEVYKKAIDGTIYEGKYKECLSCKI